MTDRPSAVTPPPSALGPGLTPPDAENTPASGTLRAIGLMVCAMAAFSLTDAGFKGATAQMPVGQAVATVGLLGVALFAVLCRRRGLAVWDRQFFDRAVLIRNIGEALAVGCLAMALSLVPLSLASAIYQGIPLAVTLGAAVLLGERIGPWRLGALIVGFLGMLLILRPGGLAFDPNALFAFAAVFAMAARDLSTRFVPRRLATVQLAAWGFAATVPVGLALMIGQSWVMPDAAGAGFVLMAAAMGAVGYVTITASLRIGEVSAVAPYRYSRLLFALLLAVLFFGERPDATTLAGAALLVLAGLVTLWREGVRRSH